MLASGRTADDIVAADGLTQIDDEPQIVALIGEVLGRHADAVAQYRSGRTALWGFFVGQVMKASNGTADPQVVQKVLADRLR